MSDKYIFFWGGPFSQWFPCQFTIDEIDFNCAEQWMMFRKAMLFEDYDTAKSIMYQRSPKEQKKLGRSVIGYDDDKWMEVAFDIVVEGNMAKFSQSPLLYDTLKSSGDKIIVEASPYDRRWGIGLAEDAPGIEDPNNWRGDNLLGKAIMKVRAELFGV